MDDINADNRNELWSGPIRLQPGESQRVGLITIHLASLVFEDIAEAPGAVEDYPAGSGVIARLRLAHDFGMSEELDLELLSPPYNRRQEAQFFGYRLSLINASQGPGTDGAELRITQDDDRNLRPLGRLHLRFNAWQDLPGFGWLRFVRHGHKRTLAEGPSSPLIVVLEYGRLLTKCQEVSVETRNGTGTWSWGRWRFYLLDYHYGEWMEVLVARRTIGNYYFGP